MLSLFDMALQKENFSPQMAELARSIFQQESGSGTNTKTSSHNATGGMQIIPSTFKSVADKGWDINNPEHNYRAGLRYLKQMNDYADGDMRLTAIGYYGGPGGINKARKGIAVSDRDNPNAPNTFGYADQVLSRMGNQESPIQQNPMDAMNHALPQRPDLAPYIAQSQGTAPVAWGTAAGMPEQRILPQEQRGINPRQMQYGQMPTLAQSSGAMGELLQAQLAQLGQQNEQNQLGLNPLRQMASWGGR